MIPAARYNPLYARAVHTPRPWGVTALFTEYTGAHQPISVAWTSQPSLLNLEPMTSDTLVEESVKTPAIEASVQIERTPAPPFSTIGDFAKALNRRDPIALELAARDPLPDMRIEGPAVKRLIGAFWFGSIFPDLSASWRERLLNALADSVVIPNHLVSRGRHAVHLADGSYEELKEIAATTAVGGVAGTDLYLVLTVVRLWGGEARSRLRFVDEAASGSSLRLGARFGHR